MPICLLYTFLMHPAPTKPPTPTVQTPTPPPPDTATAAAHGTLLPTPRGNAAIAAALPAWQFAPQAMPPTPPVAGHEPVPRSNPTPPAASI